MKKSVLLFMFCCIALAGRAADAPKYFAVWLKNGHRIDLLLSDKPNVTFTEGVLKFEAPGTTIEYKAADVKEFTLETTQSSAIQGVSANGNGCRISQSGNTLGISGAEPYAKLHLYSMGGMLISTYSADGQGSLSISLDPLDQGVYILKTDAITFKILKR